MTSITSAYDAIGYLREADLMGSGGSDLTREAYLERANGAQIHRLVFGAPEKIESLFTEVAVRRPIGDADAVEKTAEFAEIPVIDPTSGKPVVKKLEKHTVGIRVSWEQHSLNSGRAVQREVDHLHESVNRWHVGSMLDVLDESASDSVPIEDRIETLVASETWRSDTSKPLGDLLAAQSLIMGAKFEGVSYGYRPSVMLAHPLTATHLAMNPSLQSYYQGNMASANPYFSGVSENPKIGAVQLATDFNVPEGDVWVLQGAEIAPVGREWSYARLDGNLGDLPGRLSDWYEENGQSGMGGSTMSYRADYVNFGAKAITDPKAIVKITGVV